MSTEAAKNFSFYWNRRGYEKGETQKFWLGLFHDVFDFEKPGEIIDFEKKVKIDGQTKYIDGYVARTKVLIEQKSFGVNLAEDVFEQAKRYAAALPKDEQPLWIIICNFAEFWVYDLKENLFEPAPKIFKLRYLPREFMRLKFFFDPETDTTPPEEKISAEALEVIKKIYDAFAKNYHSNKVVDFEDGLNKICMRLVFCLYAGDAQIFKRNQFFGYLNSFADRDRNAALQKLFEVLNTPEDQREGFSDALKNFPYVNGELFAEKIAMPVYDKDYVNASASIGTFNARKKFSWYEISPPIFGAMFESTFSRQKTQRKGGMYYTSEKNIHKVIDPLFLDDLRDEFHAAKHKQLKNRPQALLELQDKIASLNFLDPACGSGNFLTETYLSLRKLENEILDELKSLYVELPKNPVKVSVRQFYGIEIDSFAVAVAQVALWIAENQMLQETESLLGTALNGLPLSKYVTIKKANALRVDWKTVAPNVDYIIGNPPFIGARNKSDEQSRDIGKVFDGWKNLGNLDYVTCWYKKAADFIRGTNIRCAFVSTNSICQGDSVGTLWKKLFADGIHIDFAHRTFKWLSDSENMAHVHCVVVGFSSAPNSKPKKFFDGDNAIEVKNINAYLVDGEDIFVESRNEPICDVPKMHFGSMPNDGGNLIIETYDINAFLREEPATKKWIRRYVGSREFIQGLKRYCLWLVDVPLDEIKKFPRCQERVRSVQRYRLVSKRFITRLLADTPSLFAEIRQPTTNYILVPRVSSESRQYVPMGFMSPNVIASDATLIIPDAQIYHFGILTSSIHMAWMRVIGGRLESRYRYSAQIVYNNFPWPQPTAAQRRMIEESAQKILDVRKQFPDWTFAKLYNEDTMPKDLYDAHKLNDMAVALAYGFEKFLDDEARVVSELMKLYKRLTKN